MKNDLIYYSDEGEDKFLNENYFKNKRDGFFIDIGAHSGIWSSKSLFFEKTLGWNGVCVEPSPINFNNLVKNRTCKCINEALSDKEELVSFCVHKYVNNGNVVTGDVVDGIVDGIFKNYPEDKQRDTINNLITSKTCKLSDGTEKNIFIDIINIKTNTFTNIFEYLKTTHIDFINIDTEGSELPILRGIDFDIFNIDFIIYENHNTIDIIHQFLICKNFHQIYKYFNNYIFINNNI